MSPPVIAGRFRAAPVTFPSGTGIEILTDAQGRIQVVVVGTVVVASGVSTSGNVIAVPVNAASVTILAANAARLGATVTNDSQNRALFLRLSAAGAATTSSFTVSLAPAAGAAARRDYYEVPFGYTGVIVGIWSGAGAGNALVTEFT
jgi:hypothetical protein